MRRSIILRDFGRSALNDDSIASLIEYLSHARQQRRAIQRLKEADTDIAGREIDGIARKPPRPTHGLVVEGSVKVPSPGRTILYLAGRLFPLLLARAGWIGGA